MQKQDMKRIFVGIAILLGTLALLILIPLSKTQAVDRPYTRVIDPDMVVYGRTYGEWSAAWWQWAFSIPAANHPLFDTGDCNVGQSGPVFFLGGKFCATGPNAPACTWGVSTRSCTMPAGKAVYFPIFNGEDSAPEEPNYGCGSTLPPLIPGTIAELRKCVDSWTTPVTEASAEIDGKSVPNLIRNYRVQSTVFGITMPEGGVWEAIGENIPAGTYYPAADDGVYLMLAPLSPGHHYIHFTSGGSQNITYDLIVSH